MTDHLAVEPTPEPAETDAATRDLGGRLPAARELPGCPSGDDDAIIAMSSPPAHTACPNPYLREWVGEHANHDADRADPGPFATDSTAGKTSEVYKAHSFPTKVPHEAILRLILHYTKPGDIVLDGFCGTGMAGVAAQMCANPAADLRRRIELEMGQVQWGARGAILQDLSPGATFIAAGLNLPIDADAFDRASERLLDRFDAEYGWMYETHLSDGRTARIAYTVWSEVMTCPHCGAGVVFFDVASDEQTGEVRKEFDCGSCGAAVTKDSLERRFATVRTLAGDTIERVEYRPVRLEWRAGRERGIKELDDADRAVLSRVAALQVIGFPTSALPLDQMVHGSRLGPKGFTAVHHLWSDRALVSLTARGLRSDPNAVRISTGSSTQLDLPDACVDYIFVDPPFGSNFPYADLALVVESWHGVTTATAEEATTDPMKGKGLAEYAGLMERCFREFHRVLKPGRWMTVEFSNSSNAVWMAIQQALAVAGFVVADTRVLDKKQHSFRQLTAHNAVKRDLIISAYRPHASVAERVRIEQGSEDGVWTFVREHLRHLPVADVLDGVPWVLAVIATAP